MARVLFYSCTQIVYKTIDFSQKICYTGYIINFSCGSKINRIRKKYPSCSGGAEYKNKMDAQSTIDNFGWKSFNLLKKKAMEQELSWSGLVVSMSIAFFIVAGCAFIMNNIHQSLEEAKMSPIPVEDVHLGYVARAVLGIKETQAAVPDYQAKAIKWVDSLNLYQGQEYKQTVTIKNTGSKVWKASEVTFETGPAWHAFSKVWSDSWVKKYQPAKLPKDVKPGETVALQFMIRAPSTFTGIAQEHFQLMRAKVAIPGSLTRHMVTISKAPAVSAKIRGEQKRAEEQRLVKAKTSEPKRSSERVCAASVSRSEYENCNTDRNGEDGAITEGNFLRLEPLIRVGLFSTLAFQRLSADRIFDVYAGNDILVSGLPAHATVTFSYDEASRQYGVSATGITRQSRSHLRLVPRSSDAVVTLLDYRVGQKPQDNRFRNVIEFRYTTPAKKIQIINELPLESYIRGLGETTNASPVEFQKVMATAARTYAVYHYLRGVQNNLAGASTKHAADQYHVDATYDQVYRGYNSELRLTGLVRAVEATRGVVVTYANKPVVTPYFSNSDGRTRDWTEVWGGDPVPWLKSVPVPQDKGKTLYGHGVGMSARGALLMTNEGKSWQEVLTYFYTGIVLAKAY